MTKRKFYKRVFSVEVLSENPIPEDSSLKDIQHNMVDGYYSGVLRAGEQIILDGKQVAKELIEQSSSPEFFGIDEKSEDVDKQ